MEKEIKGYNGDYTITESGIVYSYKYKEKKQLKTFYNNGYEYVKLCKDNSTKHHAIHRLVLETFSTNPDNLPEVHHIDNNSTNNHLNNLKWVTRKENMEEVFKTSSPIRNFISCNLIKIETEEVIGVFVSIREAAIFASQNYGTSVSGMIRNYKSKGYRIERIEGVETKLNSSKIEEL